MVDLPQPPSPPSRQPSQPQPSQPQPPAAAADLQAQIDGLRAELARQGQRSTGLLDGPGPKLVGAALLILLLVKSFGVANFSLSTTGALLGTAPLSVLLGSVSTALYLVIPLAAMALLWLLVLRWPQLGSWRAPVAGLAATFALLSPFGYLWRVALAAVVLFLATGVLAAIPTGPARTESSYRQRVAAQAGSWQVLSWPLTAILVFALLLTLPKPWLPAETITFSSPQIISYKDHDSALIAVGYVTDTNAGWTQILESKHRFLMRVPTKDIVRRATCRVHGQALPGAKPLLFRITSGPYRSPNISCEEAEHCAMDRLPTRVPGEVAVGRSYWNGDPRPGGNVSQVPCSFPGQP